MKWRKTSALPILLIFIYVLFSAPLFGQKPPEAVLVDEHGEIPCDDTLARIDTFFSELRDNPNDSGLVVISGLPQNKHRLLFRQTIIEHQTRWREFDYTRIRYMRSQSEETRVQFWRIPAGANPPEIKDIDMSLIIPQTAKPFLMGDETKLGDQICPPVDDEEIFASFLKANPSARGNIVVRDKSPGRARRDARKILRTFNRKYGIATNRLRTFIAKFERPSNWDEAIVEYWYLP